ncbi:MAG TPA: ABC transporter substrate-binding protein [Ottowia sp.]|uniref:MlaC/ttg2D family ABC transporter substrate-binding protein n=1 Tax=Ottowia sp. TaxID=1898956 RepID=UPI002CF6251B|nr:ABC transporter substrate-binding protein [Ottowia sp.]HMN19916.1 ABC transporter substrate-binding protein [Ottowia sp.]
MNPIGRRPILLAGAVALIAPWARAADEAPDALVQRLSDQVLQAIRSDKAIQQGDLERLARVVNEVIMPNVNFTRMTASATGPAWRRATPEQREKLQAEFKVLLERTYAGALREVRDQTVEVKPVRVGADDKDVIVRSVVKGRGDPIQLDYRLERTPGQGAGWKIYDLNVLGVWLVDNYRPQFAQQINQGSIDTLIDALAQRNQANAAASTAQR